MSLPKRRRRRRRRPPLEPLMFRIPTGVLPKRIRELSQNHKIMLVRYLEKGLPDRHRDKGDFGRMLSRVDRMGWSAQIRALRHLARPAQESLFLATPGTILF